MTMGRRHIAAVAVLTLLAVAGGFLWWRSAADATLPTNGARAGYGMTMPKGQSDFTMGLLLIERPGAEVTVVEVEPRTSPNVEFRGAFTVWPRDYVDNNLTLSRQFPPRPPFDLAVRHPLGEPVPAAETAHVPGGVYNEPPPLSVMAGFRIRSGDVAAVNGIEIEYRVNGKKVRELFEHTAIVCVRPRPCNPPDEPEWEDQILRQFGLLRDES